MNKKDNAFIPRWYDAIPLVGGLTYLGKVFRYALFHREEILQEILLKWIKILLIY